ncbi:MAG: DUF1343 domain-containing protein [Desulfobacteraceae bacterium]|nr:DUF1343 domain-containing protein [Desulfobacteraceae bacterium]
MPKVATGLDIFKDHYWKKLKGCKLGLLSNQASLDSQFQSAKEIIAQLLPGQLKILFGPQHGYSGQDQDNMVETNHSYDRELKIPIFSLYSKHREPLPEMLDPIEVLIIDLQDVGTRVYTFASTMLNCLKAASNSGRKVLIFDRPNPLGGEMVEGNLLRPELYSFVGPFSLPMRHGLTMAEMARIFNHVFKIEVDLDIVTMSGWNRNMVWQDTDLKWIMPSPNMPLPETTQVYPGQVIWEGTNLSEGRGTCRPFEIFGAPFLDVKLIKQSLLPKATAGCYLQEISFRPTFNKWKGELCSGFMIHILDHRAYRPYFTTIALLKAIIEIHRKDFQWKESPYEYEYEKMPIDMILGDSNLRREIETGEDLTTIEEKWLTGLNSFPTWRRPYLLYT